MEEYDAIMARIHETAKNDRKRQELDSDSDLLVLASSLFNGMEGIEMGSGITLCLEGQDGQDGQDNQDSQDGQDSHEMDGIEIGGSSKALDPIFSPRKTRSGRVIRYKGEIRTQVPGNWE